MFMLAGCPLDWLLHIGQVTLCWRYVELQYLPHLLPHLQGVYILRLVTPIYSSHFLVIAWMINFFCTRGSIRSDLELSVLGQAKAMDSGNKNIVGTHFQDQSQKEVVLNKKAVTKIMFVLADYPLVCVLHIV